MKLEGFGLFVKDMGKMIRFYRDVLGSKSRKIQKMYICKKTGYYFYFLAEKILNK